MGLNVSLRPDEKKPTCLNVNLKLVRIKQNFIGMLYILFHVQEIKKLCSLLFVYVCVYSARPRKKVFF